MQTEINGVNRLMSVLAAVCFAGVSIITPLKAQMVTTWNFNSGLEGWQRWAGNNPSIVTRSGSDGHGNPLGCMQVVDNETNCNLYAYSPLTASDNLHSYAFMGYYKPNAGSSSQPGLIGHFHNASGTILTKNTNNTFREIQTSYYAPDANGWYRFVMRIPQTLLSGTEIGNVRWGIRPSANDSNYLEQSSGWADNLRHEQWLEETINLKPVMTTKYADDATANNNVGGWTDSGTNDIRNLSLTLTQLFNIPFEFVNPSSNSNKSVVALCGTSTETWYTNQVSVTLASKPYDRIYLLHTAVGASVNNTIGYVDVIYSDSSSQTLPIRVGYELADWYGGSVQGKTQPWIPSGSTNPSHSPVYLYATSLELTRPTGATIASLTFRAATGSSTPWMLLAASGATGSAGWLDLAEETASAMPNTTSWVPFVPGIHATQSNSLSLEFLLDPPAGKHGLVQVVDGHLQFENGTPVRFWGTSIHPDQGLFPTHAQADQIAETLARYGINLVRIQPDEMLIDRSYSDRQHFYAPTDIKWDQFEYFLHALKQKGIYVIFVGPTGLVRRFQVADGVTSALSYPTHRSWGYYDGVLRQLGIDYMNALMSHANRYENNIPLGQDPCLAGIMWFNEQSVFWDMASQTVDDYYSNQLKSRFNAWLLTKYVNRPGLASAWTIAGGTALGANEDPVLGTVEMEGYEFPIKSSILSRAVDSSATETQQVRTRDNIRFLQDLQSQYYADMKVLAQSMGIGCPMIGTNIITDLGEAKSHLGNHFMIQNHYWQLACDTGTTYYTQNRPEVVVNPLDITNSPLTETCMTSTKTSGSALGVTETNTGWPFEWRSGHMMSVAAIGALQNHDILMQYAFYGGFGVSWNTTFAATSILYPTFEHNDPANLSGIMAGAFLFLRGDVQTAPNLVQLQIDQTMELSMQNGLWSGAGYPANYLTFVTRFENSFLSQVGGNPPSDYESGTADGMTSSGTYVLVSRGNAKPEDGKARAIALDTALKSAGVIPSSRGLQGNKLISATGEIVRNWGNQLMTINTPRSQGFTGFPSTAAIALNDLAATSRSPYVTFQVSSLDNMVLSQSKKMLMIASSRAENQITNRRYMCTSQSTPMGTFRGEGLSINKNTYSGPVLLEPVKMTIQMNGSANTNGGYLRLTPYNADMTPSVHVSVFPVDNNNQANIVLENAIVSPWYQLERFADKKLLESNFNSDMIGWRNYTPSGYRDTTKGYSANGSVRIIDDSITSNPGFATLPYQAADANHSYRLSGWYWRVDAETPRFFAYFYNGGGSNVRSFSNSSSNAQFFVSEPDANGWREFRFYIPQSSLAGASIERIEIGLRPAPDGAANTAMGEVWVDDLKLEQLEGHALAWSFDGNLTGWRNYCGSQTVDTTKSHTGTASVFLNDTNASSNPSVATLPYLSADSNHSYCFSGWYWRDGNDSTIPRVFAYFYKIVNGSMVIAHNFNNQSANVQFETSAPDSNGWKRFRMYIPKTALTDISIAKLEMGVCPAPKGASGAYVGQIWIDDLALEMIPE